MKKICSVLVMLLLLSSVAVPASLAKDKPLAPHFTLQDLQGNKVSLATYRNGKPALLFFWTTWCPFCRKELAALDKRYAEIAGTGCKVLAVDVGESASRVTDFMKNMPLAFNVLLDSDTSVAYLYEVMGVPTFILVNAQGRVVFRDNYFPENYQELLLK